MSLGPWIPSPPQGGVLCSGAAVYDVLVRPVDESPWGTTTFVETIGFHPGGNAANTSIALGSLGVPVRIYSMLGDDEQARFLECRLTAAGVDTAHLARTSASTPVTIVLVKADGNRKFFHRPSGDDSIFSRPFDFTPELIAGLSRFHLASFFILPRFRQHAPETLRRASAAGLITSFDTNWDPEGRWMNDLAPCLPYVDTLFVNEDEARMLTGDSDPRRAAHALLDHGVRMAVVKLGRLGCGIYTRDTEVRCPAFDVTVKDTTGAGDCFVAGFLGAQLRGATLEQAGQFANAVGALNVQRIGASAGIGSWAAVEQWMHTARPTAR